MVRLSVTDWIEGGVTVEKLVEFVCRLKAAGLDTTAGHAVLVGVLDAVVADRCSTGSRFSVSTRDKL